MTNTFEKFIAAQTAFNQIALEESTADSAIKQAIQARKAVGKRKETALNTLNEVKATLLAEIV